MKKVLSSIFVLALMVAMLPVGTAFADGHYDLIAGQNIDVGSVTVTDDGTTLSVTYDIDVEGWWLVQAHLYAGTSAPKKGAPGSFPFQSGPIHATSYTFEVSLAELTKLFCEHGVPVHIRSDNGSEFTANRVRAWLKRLDIKPLFIEPGSPWENGYIESFNGKMRDELLAREIFYSLKEAQVLIEMWRRQYNTVRPHSALGYRPPAPAAIYIQPEQNQPVGLTL